MFPRRVHLVGVSPEGTLSREISTLRMDNGLCDQLFDLMNYFDLLCDEGEYAILSIGDSRGVFPQNWLPPQLFYTGLLEVTGPRFDVIVRALFRASKSAHFGAEPVVSDVTEDGDGIPMTTSARSWGGESGCSEWLQFVSQGVGPMAPPIRARLNTVVFSRVGGWCIPGLCTLGENQLESCK